MLLWSLSSYISGHGSFTSHFDEVLVKREGFSFKVEIRYKWLPEYSSQCHIICHHASNCCWLHPQNNNMVDKGMKLTHPQKPYVQNWPANDNPRGIGSSKEFEKQVDQQIAVTCTSQKIDNSLSNVGNT